MSFIQTGDYANANIGTFNEVKGNQINTTHVYPGAGDNSILEKLNPVDHNRRYVQPCMEGTREDIFKTIHEWTDDKNADKNILWIKGSPGAGKSAIASSLISQLRAARRLGGSFSFLRGDATLSDPATVWRTVASDLARFNADIASTVASALKDGRVDPQKPDIKSHFDILIKQPLQQLEEKYNHSQQDRSYPVVVMDALDECGNTSQDE